MEKDMVVFIIVEMHVYCNTISDYYQWQRPFFLDLLQFKKKYIYIYASEHSICSHNVYSIVRAPVVPARLCYHRVHLQLRA